MLLTETVIVKWSNYIKKYYEDKGYIYTKQFDEFEVKVEDLPKRSGIFVEVKCDCEDCKDPYLKPMTYQNYNKGLKENNKYYCQKCVYNLYGSEKANKTKLLKSKSFEQWCYDNLSKEEADKILSRWDYEKNIDKNGNVIKPSDIAFSSHGFNKKGYWFKCLKHLEHKSELKRIDNFVHGSEDVILCKQCNSFAQWGIDNLGDDFLDKYWDYEKNTFSPWEISYGSHNKVFIRCQNKDYHGNYKIRCADFAIGNRCPYCTNHHGKVHPLDSLGKLLEDRGLLHLWSENNKKSPYTYTTMNGQEVWWKCECGKHEDYPRRVSESTKLDFRCPECSRERDESFLQEKVRLYLNELGYTILHEYKCSVIAQNPKVKNKTGRMPYDNEVVELRLICEVHGYQHYESSGWNKRQAKKRNTTPEYELHIQQVRDRYKRIFAKHMGYEYLEIPYWTEGDESYKDLINNKIKEILERKCV